MAKKNVFLGCDHAGFSLHSEVSKKLTVLGFNVQFLGTYNEERCDYPDLAKKVCHEVLGNEEAAFGVLICGTGIGMCIAANKCKGIRCANVYDSFSARLAKMHNNANVIALGARTALQTPTSDIIEAFVRATFESGRHEKRLAKVHSMEC